MSEKEFQALITLLQDPDEVVFEHVRNKILSETTNIQSKLIKEKQKSENNLLIDRINEILSEIVLEKTFSKLQEWSETKDNDLLKGAFLIEKLIYPEIDFQVVYKKISQIKRSIEIDLTNNFSPLEQVRVINHFFYKIHNFKSNYTNINSFDNYYISKVLQSKKGSPIILAIIYLSIAKKFRLPIYGVNLYKNFIISYVNENFFTSFKEKKEIIFYINPFNRGIVLGRKEIDFFLRNQKIEKKEAYYEPCSNNTIIKQLLGNLILLYSREGKSEEAEIFKEAEDILY